MSFSSLNRAKRVLVRAVTCGAVLALPSCRIPAMCKPDPPPVLPPAYNGLTTAENSAQLRIEEFFNDPVLTGLIRDALAGNQELKILAQDIRIANNEFLARRGALFPFVTIRTEAGLERTPRFTRNGAVDEQIEITPGKRVPNPLPDFLIAANFSWQVDIWRKLRNARDAAALRYLATAEGRNYVVTRLVAEIAENYYALMALDKRLEVLDQTIALQQQSLEFAQARKEAGRGNELAVQRFQAEVRKNQSEKLIVQQDIIEAENRINFLAGRFPQRVERQSAAFYDLNLPVVNVGVPSELLRNRPDVRQAERELMAAGLEVKVAKAEFFPSLDITGGVGYEAFIPRYLFNPESVAANVAGGLVAPLVNRTAIQAVFGTANARQLQALYNYQRVVLDGFTDVVNRVSMATNYQNSIQIKKQQLAALEASVTAATNLFQSGRAEYIEVLFAQRDLLDARTTLIETKRQQLTAVVNAYQALGGGGGTLPLFDAAPPQPHLWKALQRQLSMWPGPGVVACADPVTPAPLPAPAPVAGPAVPAQPPAPAPAQAPAPPQPAPAQGPPR